jgi:hypothetical protein
VHVIRSGQNQRGLRQPIGFAVLTGPGLGAFARGAAAEVPEPGLCRAYGGWFMVGVVVVGGSHRVGR